MSDEQKFNIRESLEKIFKRLDDLEEKINRVSQVPEYPSIPTYPTHLGGSTTCSKCGMVWSGVMSYTCMNSECPVQLQTISQSSAVGQFEIESLDPDERSWYYDDDGTKRKK